MSRLTILLFILTVVILCAGIFTYFFVCHKTAAPLLLQPQQLITTGINQTGTSSNTIAVSSEVFSSVQTNVPNPGLPESLTLVYSTTASSTLTENRLWQNINIWKKVGNTAPKLVGRVGTIGEYAAAEVVSPTHNYVAINLEQSVDIIDLQTKQKRRVLSQAEWVIGITFSLDGSKLFITDGATFANNPVKKFHTIDLVTGVDTVLTPDQSIPEIDPVVWRKDGALLYYPVSYKDCGSSMESFSFVTGKGALSFERYGLSDDGTAALGKELESLPNPEDGMCTPSVIPTIVSVVDPVSGKMLGAIGKSGEPLTFIAFSPDNTKVLYKTSLNQRDYTYYLQDVSITTKPAIVSDPNALLASWKSNTGPVSYASQNEDRRSLYVDHKPIVTLEKEPSQLTSEQVPTLIAQYFQ